MKMVILAEAWKLTEELGQLCSLEKDRWKHSLRRWIEDKEYVAETWNKTFQEQLYNDVETRRRSCPEFKRCPHEYVLVKVLARLAKFSDGVLGNSRMSGAGRGVEDYMSQFLSIPISRHSISSMPGIFSTCHVPCCNETRLRQRIPGHYHNDE